MIATAPPATDRQWIVLHTRSRQEKAVAAQLAARGCEHFLPLINRTRIQGGRRRAAELPLFPGYVFLRGFNDDAYEADRTKRIVQIIAVEDQAGLTNELANIRRALAAGAPLDPYSYLHQGRRVAVRSGPFAGVQGVIEDRGRIERILLQVDMLGRALSLEVDGALLDPLD